MGETDSERTMMLCSITRKAASIALLIFVFVALFEVLPAFTMLNSDEITIVQTTVPAPSLANDLFGNSTEQPCVIYLPPSYNDSYRRYPVIYFLPGYGEAVSLYKQLFKYVGSLYESIVVVGSGYHSTLVGSFYTNSPVLGNREDYIVYDLVGHIDANFRTVDDSSFRGIAGFSMGGYGALTIAMKHPDIFGSAYAIAPGLFDENGLLDSNMLTPYNVNQFLVEEEYLAGLNRTAAHAAYSSFLAHLRGSPQLFALAYGSAFSPDISKNAPYIDYPYYYSTSSMIVRNDSPWTRYENGFGGIDEKIVAYGDNLRSLLGIGVEYGLLDENVWIPRGCRYFVEELREQNITCQLTVTDYSHNYGLQTRIQRNMMPFFGLVFKTMLETDLNGDATVNVADLAVAAHSFGARPGSTAWNFLADVDRNRVVDIVDLVRIARDFGKHGTY